MEKIIYWSRKAYAICIIGIGVQQWALGIISANFLPNEYSGNPVYHLLIYPWGIVFTLSGFALLLEKKAYEVSLVSAGIFLALLFFFNIPYFTFFTADRKNFLEWAPVVQESSFAGASLIFAASYPNNRSRSAMIRWLEKLIPFGRIFFSVMLIAYGIDHYLYTKLVATLVPSWIPFPIFWTYLAGTALIAAGVAIILKIKLKLTGILLATMIFLWMVTIHLPNVITHHFKMRDIEMSRVFVTFGFTGIALLLAFSQEKMNKRYSITS